MFPYSYFCVKVTVEPGLVAFEPSVLAFVVSINGVLWSVLWSGVLQKLWDIFSCSCGFSPWILPELRGVCVTDHPLDYSAEVLVNLWFLWQAHYYFKSFFIIKNCRGFCKFVNSGVLEWANNYFKRPCSEPPFEKRTYWLLNYAFDRTSAVAYRIIVGYGYCWDT